MLARKRKKNIELARALHVDPRTVSKWCVNDNQPDFATLFNISEYLDVELRDLISLKKDLHLLVDNKKPSKAVRKNSKRKKKD